MQSSFLDPRFQGLQSAEDILVIKSALKKLHDVDPDQSEPLSVKKEKVTHSTVNKSKSGRVIIPHFFPMFPLFNSAIFSVGLKFFFGNKEHKSLPNKTIDRFDLEFNNYNTNADASLDQVVSNWWKESALLYPNLRKIANRFNCVLLSVQKCEQNIQKQISFFEKRANCSGNAVDNLLWLHQNRLN